ncbi:MAG: hypothetical protein ABR987_22730 [Terracidiphilus sp.]
MLNGVYSGTKALVVNFTQSLSNEAKDKGNGIHFGFEQV